MTDTGLLRSFSENPAAFFVNGFTAVLREKNAGTADSRAAPHGTSAPLRARRISLARCRRDALVGRGGLRLRQPLAMDVSFCRRRIPRRPAGRPF